MDDEQTQGKAALKAKSERIKDFLNYRESGTPTPVPHRSLLARLLRRTK